jgi:two-component system OmpR family sensor kinase
MFTKSIRWRLQLWSGVILVCVLSGFGITASRLHRISQFNQIDEELKRRAAALSVALRGGPGRDHDPGHAPDFGHPPIGIGPAGPGFGDEMNRRHPEHERPDTVPPRSPWGIRPEPRDFRPSAEVTSLFDGAQPDGFYYAVWFREQSSPKFSTNAPADMTLPAHTARDTRTYLRTRADYREAFQFTELGDCVLAGRSIIADLNAMHRFTLVLLAAGSAVLALGLGGGWWLTNRAIRPLEEISAAAGRISAGNLSERINTVDPDNEIGRLAGVLNSTFARLEAAFVQQKQFTADASHELRTPLAVIISEAQTTLARKRSAAEYRETVEACLDTAQQMRQLTESLLELARIDAGREQPRHDPLNLAEMASACVERLRPVATHHGLQFHCDLSPAKAPGNAVRFGQVIMNLLTNAIHYNRPNGHIRVSTRTENGAAILTVADTGVGIAAEDLPHIFERFYRADKSRARAEGRSGLGLAICKAILDAHGGSLEVSTEPGVGTAFTVRCPGGS